jgi:hypothetical protein
MRPETTATTTPKTRRRHQSNGPNASELRRAAKALLQTHGAGNALHVAAQRAINSGLSGSAEAAETWLQIALILRRWGPPSAAKGAPHHFR